MREFISIYSTSLEDVIAFIVVYLLSKNLKYRIEKEVVKDISKKEYEIYKLVLYEDFKFVYNLNDDGSVKQKLDCMWYDIDFADTWILDSEYKEDYLSLLERVDIQERKR